MVLNNCYGFVKYTLVFVNLIFWAVGLATAVLAIWMLVDNTFLISLTEEQQNLYNGLYIMLAAGALMVFLSFLGCCGTLRESQCLLVCFFSCLLIIIVAQISAGAWLFTNSIRLKEIVKGNVAATIKHEYGQIESRTRIIDAFQADLRCCGANGPYDWATSRFNGNHKDSGTVINLTVSREKNPFNVPESCCKQRRSDECNKSRHGLIVGGVIPQEIWTDGCSDRVLQSLESVSYILVYAVLGLLAIEVLGLLFSLIICCALGSQDRYKG